MQANQKNVSLTMPQLEYLTEVKRTGLISIFKKESLQATEDRWKLIDYKENHRYRDPDLLDSEKLRCEDCGRELKYQYIVEGEQSGIVKKLGINHFAKHLGIPEKTAREVKRLSDKIDSILDYILAKVAKGETFPKELYEQVKNSKYAQEINLKHWERIDRFKELDLPLLEDDEASITAAYRRICVDIEMEKRAQEQKEIEERLSVMQKNERVQSSKWRKGTQMKLFNLQDSEKLNYYKPEALKATIGFLKKVEIGEEVDVEILVEDVLLPWMFPKYQAGEATLEESQEKLLMSLESNLHSYQLKKVNGRYFRVK